jgi:hypothetical protein
MKEFASPGHLSIGPVPDLSPDGVGRVGVGQPLGHDALEAQSLHGSEEVACAATTPEDRRVRTEDVGIYEVVRGAEGGGAVALARYTADSPQAAEEERATTI